MGIKKLVTVRWGAPRKVEAGEWLCPYQIRGLGSARVDVAYGLDALQALMMAFEAVRLRLGRKCTVKSTGRCDWDQVLGDDVV